MFKLTPYEIYIFFLCVIVFVLLTVLFIVLFSWIVRLSVRGIRFGLEDKQVLKEYKKNKGKRPQKAWGIFDAIVSTVFCVAAFVAFGFSVYTHIYQDQVTTGLPMWRVVLSDSMATKNEKNEHLFKNGLDNQFRRFDLVLTEALPKEEDLQLYDIVVYEVEDTLVIHRIVGIEEPSEKHPGERWFLLQGDALVGKDRFPVLYSQMRAIYKDTRVPFLGSFVAFLQSPAGYLCILLVVFAMFSVPYMEKKLGKEREMRLKYLLESGKVDENGEEIEEKPQPVAKVQSGGCCPMRCPHMRAAQRAYGRPRGRVPFSSSYYRNGDKK